MGVSTDGIIAFGVLCEEGVDFPWDSVQFEGDEEAWWRDVNGFVPLFSPYKLNGDYADGWSKDDPRLDLYFGHQREWMAANPIPVRLENYCSGDYPMFAIVVPDSVVKCNRGYPVHIDPKSLTVKDEQIEALNSFLDKYEIEYDCSDGGPRWLLMSYWG